MRVYTVYLNHEGLAIHATLTPSKYDRVESGATITGRIKLLIHDGQDVYRRTPEEIMHHTNQISAERARRMSQLWDLCGSSPGA